LPDLYSRHRRTLISLLPALSAALLCEHALAAPAPDSIAVIYPDIGQPHRKIFTEIIEGIEEQAKLRVRGYPVAANADFAELQATLKRNGGKVVIALGRQGLQAASAFDSSTGVVVGGVSSAPDGERLRGITLLPDPALLFSYLKSMMPHVRRVIVVYSPQASAGMIRLAKDAARSHALELVALEAPDLAAAARRYESALSSADGRSDALWLPPDPVTVDEQTIVPLVLKESWNRNVPIFSSSILHVKKGALFALYPNNFELGRDLATLAIGVLNGDNPRLGMAPLRAVRTAFNWRSASHFGLSVALGQQRTYDAIFPEP
jgi:putative tryptophan/tyrosine transport system substrate-binding protein